MPEDITRARGFTSHSTQNRCFLKPVGLVWKKLNLAQQEHAFTDQKNVRQHKHTHTHPFNGPLSMTTHVSWYQKR